MRDTNLFDWNSTFALGQLAREVKACAQISTGIGYDGFINHKSPEKDGNVQKKKSLRIGRHAHPCQIIGRLCDSTQRDHHTSYVLKMHLGSFRFPNES